MNLLEQQYCMEARHLQECDTVTRDKMSQALYTSRQNL